jgi:hypothetical protein
MKSLVVSYCTDSASSAGYVDSRSQSLVVSRPGCPDPNEVATNHFEVGRRPPDLARSADGNSDSNDGHAFRCRIDYVAIR